MNEQAMNMCVEWRKGDVDIAQRQFFFLYLSIELGHFMEQG